MCPQRSGPPGAQGRGTQAGAAIIAGSISFYVARWQSQDAAKQATKQAIASQHAGATFPGVSPMGDLRCRICHKRITVPAQRQTLP